MPKHEKSLLKILRENVWLWGSFTFFGVLAMGQLERVQWGSFPAFYIHDLILIGFVGWLGSQKEWRSWLQEKLKRVPTLGWLSLGWVGAGLAIAALTGHPVTYSLLIIARLTLYTLAASGLSLELHRHKFDPQFIRGSLIFFFIALAYFGFLQYTLMPDTRLLLYLGWDDHYYRLISTIFDPGFTGLLLALGYLFLQESCHLLSKTYQRYLGVISVSITLALLLTYSRASYLAFGVILFFLFWQKWISGKKTQAILQIALGVLFVISLFVLPRPGGEGVKLERTSTIDARMINAGQTLRTVNTAPNFILGHGLFVPVLPIPTSIYSGTLSHAQVPDNWIIMILSGTGVVGLVLGLAIIIKLLRWSYARPHSYLWIAVLAILVHGLFSASLIYPFVWIVLLSWGVLTIERQ